MTDQDSYYDRKFWYLNGCFRVSRQACSDMLSTGISINSLISSPADLRDKGPARRLRYVLGHGRISERPCGMGEVAKGANVDRCSSKATNYIAGRWKESATVNDLPGCLVQRAEGVSPSVGGWDGENGKECVEWRLWRLLRAIAGRRMWRRLRRNKLGGGGARRISARGSNGGSYRKAAAVAAAAGPVALPEKLWPHQ